MPEKEMEEGLARRIREEPREVPEAKSRVCFSGDRALNGVKFHRRGKGSLGDCVESSVSGKGNQGRMLQTEWTGRWRNRDSKSQLPWENVLLRRELGESQGWLEGSDCDDVPWNLGWTKRDEDRWQTVKSGGQWNDSLNGAEEFLQRWC